MNEEQRRVLLHLRLALEKAADSGLLDAMWLVTHPDVVNSFCNAVAAMHKAHE